MRRFTTFLPVANGIVQLWKGGPIPTIREMMVCQGGEFLTTVPPQVFDLFVAGLTYDRETLLVRSGFLPLGPTELSYLVVPYAYESEQGLLEGVAEKLSERLRPWFEFDASKAVVELRGGSSPEVVVFGTAWWTHLLALVGGPPVAYLEARVGLEPEHSPAFPHRVIKTNLLNYNLLSPSAASPLVAITYAIVKAAIRPLIDKSIQEALDKAIRKELDDKKVPAGATLTVHHMRESEGKLSAVVIAAAHADSLDGVEFCPATLSASPGPIRAASQSSALRAIRQRFLTATPSGRSYARAFVRHRKELVRLLMRRPEHIKRLDALAASIQMFANPNSDAVIDDELVVAVKALARELIADASPELSRTLEWLNVQFSAFAGMNAKELVDHLQVELEDLEDPEQGAV